MSVKRIRFKIKIINIKILFRFKTAPKSLDKIKQYFFQRKEFGTVPDSSFEIESYSIIVVIVNVLHYFHLKFLNGTKLSG